MICIDNDAVKLTHIIDSILYELQFYYLNFIISIVEITRGTKLNLFRRRR